MCSMQSNNGVDSEECQSRGRLYVVCKVLMNFVVIRKRTDCQVWMKDKY